MICTFFALLMNFYMCYNAIVEEAGRKPCFFFFILDSSFESMGLPIFPTTKKSVVWRVILIGKEVVY